MKLIHQYLETNAENIPDKTAIISEKESYTYAEFDRCVNSLANYLIAHGIKKGDKIAVIAKKEPELVITFLAASKIGAIFVPINFNDPKSKLEFFMNDLKPSAIILSHEFTDLLDEKSTESLNSDLIIIYGIQDSKFAYWGDIIAQSPSSRSQSPDLNPDDVVYYNVTSGSTGMPKFAITTHRQIYWNTIASNEAFKINGDDVHLCMFAAFMHPHELFVRALFTGGAIVLLDSVFPKAIASAIEKYKITCVMGLASLYEMLLEYANSKQFDFSSLRLPESGGMFTKIPLLREFENKIGVPIFPVWGSTETCGIAIANRFDGDFREGSAGKPLNYYNVKIVNEQWEEVGENEIGELVFKGEGVVSGYANSLSTSFKDGWYFSRDLAKRDKDGFIYFAGRRSDMLKSGGMKVFPAEIESVLVNHPKIKNVAVIGVFDAMRGEVPKAFIVANNGEELTQEEVKIYCRQHLSRFKLPRVVEFLDELPKLPNGKINKKALLR